MEPDELAEDALAFLGRGPLFVPGAANRAVAKGLSPLPRIPLINAMSRATAELYRLPHVEAHGEE